MDYKPEWSLLSQVLLRGAPLVGLKRSLESRISTFMGADGEHGTFGWADDYNNRPQLRYRRRELSSSIYLFFG